MIKNQLHMTFALLFMESIKFDFVIFLYIRVFTHLIIVWRHIQKPQ